MSEFMKNTIFLAVSAILILPIPVLILAYMTGLTFQQVLWR